MKKINVLCIDDDLALCRNYTEFFNNSVADMSFRCKPDFNITKCDLNNINTVLLDAFFDGIDRSVELSGFIKSVNPAIKIILYSGHEQTKEAALCQHIDHYIQKDCGLRHFKIIYNVIKMGMEVLV